MFLLPFAKSCKMGANRVRFDEEFEHFSKIHLNDFNYLRTPSQSRLRHHAAWNLKYELAVLAKIYFKRAVANSYFKFT